jgi:hypothetical protein
LGPCLMSFSFTNASTKKSHTDSFRGQNKAVLPIEIFNRERFRETPSWGTSRRTRNILKFSEIQAQCMNIQAVWLHTHAQGGLGAGAHGYAIAWPTVFFRKPVSRIR